MLLLVYIICLMVSIIAAAGKGGVGKSTVSHGIAVALADRGEKTLIIDCDKDGKATRRVLFPSGNFKVTPNDISDTGVDNLYAGAAVPKEYWDLPRMDDVESMSAKKRNVQFGKFMEQFPGRYGLVAYNILLNQFFGAATDPEKLSDLLSLTKILEDAERNGIERLVFDLEPTSGTRRMLRNATQTARTLKAMSEYSMAKVIAVGVQFPDIKRFLKTAYMKNAKEHGDSLMKYAEQIVGADYILVCGPEISLVEEMFDDTEAVIRSYGGKVSKYVINNCRTNLEGIEASMQKDLLRRVRGVGAKKDISVYEVWHDSNLNSKVSDNDRLSHLREVGKKIL